MSDELTEGWAFPSWDARKCHYYGEDRRSLCGKWAYVAALAPPPGLQPDEGASPDDCAACRRKLDKRLAAR
jgi:hypothetical protein